MRNLRTTLLGLALLASASLATADSGSGGVGGVAQLAADGRVYAIQKGTYGDLFPTGDELPEGFEVLALDIVDPESGTQRSLVPGTENRFGEVSESVVYESRSQILYVLWEGFHNFIHPRIYLTSFDSDGWGELLEIGPSPFGRKSSPQLVVTQDAFDSEESSLPWTERTILHLTWWEDRHNGSTKIYTPLVFEDGVYVGPESIVDMPQLLQGSSDDSLLSFPEVSPGIANALRVQAGRNHQSTVIGLLEPGSGDLVVLDFEVLPAALIDLAEKARLHIINLGAKDSLGELAEAAAEILHELDTDFHEVTLAWFAEQVRLMIESSDDDMSPEGIERIAGKARLHIINLGSKMGNHGLAETEIWGVLEVPSSVEGTLGHFVKVSVASRRAAPQTTGEATLFLSETGQDVIVGWHSDSRVYYVVSAEDSWSETKFLTLGNELNLEQAFALLENRVRSR